MNRLGDLLFSIDLLHLVDHDCEIYSFGVIKISITRVVLCKCIVLIGVGYGHQLRAVAAWGQRITSKNYLNESL